MDEQVIQNVYILGKKSNIKRCFKAMTGRAPDIGDMVTDKEDVRLVTDEVSMEYLKEHQEHNMEIEEDSLDLSRSTYSSRRVGEPTSPPKMKRLKTIEDNNHVLPSSSKSYANSDVGYESDTAESEERHETRANICAIIVEDDDNKTGWNKNLTSFVFTTLVWPALVLLPIDSELDINLYVDFITELGIHAAGKKDKSKLMVVGISSQTEEVQKQIIEHKDRLECDILDSYFGTNFDFCEMDNFVSKVTESLYRECKGPTSSQKVKIERNEEMLKSHELINRFRNIMTDILKMSPVRCTIGIYEFMKRINHTSEKRLFIDNLERLNLIHEQGHKSDKCITLIPLICSGIIPEFVKVEYRFDTNPLQIEANLGIIPSYLRANIFKILFDKGWSVKYSGPQSCQGDTFLFSKEAHTILIHFKSSEQNTSIVCLYSLKTCEKTTDSLAVQDYEELRKNIGNELKMCKQRTENENDSVKYYVKPKPDHLDIETAITEEEGQWIEVDLKNVHQKIASNMTRYLYPWFSSEVAKFEKDLNLKMNDSILSDISGLFGKGYLLFFVNQGLDKACLERIDFENQKSIKDAVFQMLQEWRKDKGTSANLAVLRSALAEKSCHVSVNLHDFDEIVKKHDDNN